MDKRCWISLARLTGLGLPFPEGDSGYETCSQSCPCLQALCSLVLLVLGLQSGLELSTEVWGSLHPPAFRVLCKNLEEALLLVWNDRVQKTTVKMQWSGMPGLLQKCLFLIKGSGMICPDRPDCTSAWHQHQPIMWLYSMVSTLPQAGLWGHSQGQHRS